MEQKHAEKEFARRREGELAGRLCIGCAQGVGERGVDSPVRLGQQKVYSLMPSIRRAGSTRDGKLCQAYLGALASVSFVRPTSERKRDSAFSELITANFFSMRSTSPTPLTVDLAVTPMCHRATLRRGT